MASWLEHLRQHQRVANADRIVQDAIREFGAAAEPKITYFTAARLHWPLSPVARSFAIQSAGWPFLAAMK